MKKIVLLCGTAISVLCSFCPVNDSSQLVLNAARQECAKELGLIPKGSENNFGFTSRDEFANCTLGNPCQMLQLTDEIYNTTVFSTTAQYITTTNEWRVPVQVKGINRVLLAVSNDNNSYHVVDMGGAGLAKEMQERIGTNTSQYHMLRIYALEADFLVQMHSSSFADARFIPMHSALMAIPAMTDKADGYSLKDVLVYIKNALDNRAK